jgi:hypothetical protein
MGVLMFGAKLPEFQNIAVGFITTTKYMLGSGVCIWACVFLRACSKDYEIVRCAYSG